MALDARGRSAAAVSTGGIVAKPVGRIGDSPVVGAGFWADNRCGACVTTGIGEVLLREGTARRCVQLMSTGLCVAEAAATALAELADDDGDGCCGLIAVSKDGEVALDHSAAAMTAAWGNLDGARAVASSWHE